MHTRNLSMQAASAHIGNLFKQHPKLLPQETCVSSIQVTQPVQAVSTRNLSKQCPSYSHKKPVTRTRNLPKQCPSYSHKKPVTRTRNLSKQCPSYSHKKPVTRTRNLSMQCPSYSHKKPVQVTNTRSLSKQRPCIMFPMSMPNKHVQSYSTRTL